MSIIDKYAKLLLGYCLDIQPGEKLYISTTTAAVPLVQALYKEGLKKGAIIETDLSFPEMNAIYLKNANEEQLAYVPILKKTAMESFDAYLAIKASENLREDQEIPSSARGQRRKAFSELNQTYFQRTADGSLKRSLCLYPTNASAQAAGMSFSDYQKFVFQACRLYDEDPHASWLTVRNSQQKLVDHLNKSSTVQYKNSRTDISFSTKGRTWINSDGRTNMPSGEVFTGPVEDSVNGYVYFDFPSIYLGKEVRGIRLEVKDGQVVDWSAEVGQDVLDQVFAVDGARYFGEAAIGTNYNIDRATKNILFDEKIGGTIHMAVGQSYKQTGGKNQSSIHWDMIADMKENSEIIVDGEVIYRDGVFLNGLLT